MEERSRDRILGDQEIKWLWRACDVVGYPFGSFAKLLLLTGQRRTEVAGMSRSEITDATWSIPGQRTKNGEPHEVPLSSQALAIIESAPRIRTTAGFVFTTKADKHVRGYSQAKAAIETRD